MLKQTKTLKDALREVGIKDHGKTPSVETERHYIGKKNGKSMFEYGHAYCIIDNLSIEHEKALKNINKYFQVNRMKEDGVEYWVTIIY